MRRSNLLILAIAALAIPAATTHAAGEPDGRVLYLRYCASCHGINADGRGPVAKALAVPPADLRTLAKTWGSPLPADKLASFVDGREAVAAHGDREMPVWGERFNDIRAAGAARESAVKDRIAKIVAYLNSIQQRGN